MITEEWFESWFNTHYYHLLYKNRDEQEARQLMDALLRFLAPPANCQFLDVACGSGRHSHYLNDLGYTVTGIDLSENCIDTASAKSRSNLRFLVRDIRQPLDLEPHDIALNLFTSFGYFETLDEHIAAVQHIGEALRPGGRFVLDYLNPSHVKFHLIQKERMHVDGVDFSIRRSVNEGFISKEITVSDKGEIHHFRERVMAFSRDDLYEILIRAGLTPLHCFGDYELSPYDSGRPRIIIIAQKDL